MKILQVLLVIVIGLSLVGTVATSTSSASTALAVFSGAQSLVIIVPLIFVAIILFAAYSHIQAGGKRGRGLFFDMTRAKSGVWRYLGRSRIVRVFPKLPKF